MPLGDTGSSSTDYSSLVRKAAAKKVSKKKPSSALIKAQQTGKKVGALLGAPFGLLPAGIGALIGHKTAREPAPQTFKLNPATSGEGIFYDTVGKGENEYAKKASGDADLKAIMDMLKGVAKPGAFSLKGLPGVNYGQTAADLNRAKDLVQLEYGAKESALQRAMKQQKTDYSRLLSDLNEAMTKEITTSREFGKAGDIKLEQLYGALKNELGENLTKTQDIFAKGTEAVKGAYSQAGQIQDASGEKVNAALAERAKQLGIEAATPEALAGLVAEQQGAVSRTAESGAAAQSNLINAGTTEAGVQQRGIAGAAREGTQERANLVMSVNDAITQINIHGMQGKRDLSRGLQDALTELNGQLSQIRGERGVALREAVRQVSEARSANERQRRLDALNEQLQVESANMSRQENYTNQLKNAADSYLLPYQIQAEKKKLSGEGAGVTMEDLLKIIDLSVRSSSEKIPGIVPQTAMTPEEIFQIIAQLQGQIR